MKVNGVDFGDFLNEPWVTLNKLVELMGPPPREDVGALEQEFAVKWNDQQQRFEKRGE